MRVNRRAAKKLAVRQLALKSLFAAGEKRAFTILDILVDEGLAEVSSQKRRGTNDLKVYRKVCQSPSVNGSHDNEE